MKGIVLASLEFPLQRCLNGRSLRLINIHETMTSRWRHAIAGEGVSPVPELSLSCHCQCHSLTDSVTVTRYDYKTNHRKPSQTTTNHRKPPQITSFCLHKCIHSIITHQYMSKLCILMQNFDFESTLKSLLRASFSTDIPAIAKST